MASNDVKLGLGRASGMFYHAPKGTSLPAYPGASLTGYTEIGNVSEDGIVLGLAYDLDALKNWAKQIVRTVPGQDSQTVKATIMDTTKESLKTVFGKNNVVETAASGDHGTLLTIDTKSSASEEVFLFIMKDGDDMIMVGAEGYITAVDDITFKGDEAITWPVTISATDKWTIITDDGQVES